MSARGSGKSVRQSMLAEAALDAGLRVMVVSADKVEVKKRKGRLTIITTSKHGGCHECGYGKVLGCWRCGGGR